jgi:xylan 1,4-beta-xylosidase
VERDRDAGQTEGGLTVRIAVEADRPLGPLSRLWSWFGYDEPNYTTAPHGRKLLRDLAALSKGPAFVRAHNLLTSGDGTPALKWGSTGVYDEDASGAPIYSFAILDGIFDAYVEAGVVPFVQLGFMPKALSIGPEPYRHDFPRTKITTGWAYPPRDFDRWGELAAAVANHFAQRYGRTRVESWPWELWNEPDGLYWRGTVEEFCRLYDVTAAALKRILPNARIGGPHTCGPFSTKGGAPFLRSFLEHVVRNTPALDFIAYHAKGRPTLVDGRVRMGLATQLRDIADGLSIVRSFPALAGLPIILGESDPEGCAACPTTTHPENAYRDGPLYAAYTCEQLFRTQEIAERAGATIEGAVTWAFEFEGEPFFAGYRELATNGIAKPVQNLFRMLGRMGATRLVASSSGALPLDTVLAEGVRGAPDVNVLAASGEGGEVSALVWHYHDDDRPDATSVSVDFTVSGLAAGDAAYESEHYRIDATHSNAHTAWQAMGGPQKPTPEQYAALEKASELERLDPARRLVANDGTIKLAFDLPRQAMSLVRLSRAD